MPRSEVSDDVLPLVVQKKQEKEARERSENKNSFAIELLFLGCDYSILAITNSEFLQSLEPQQQKDVAGKYQICSFLAIDSLLYLYEERIAVILTKQKEASGREVSIPHKILLHYTPVVKSRC